MNDSVNYQSNSENFNSDGSIEPWYKQGWPWALIAIPLLTIIACSVTIWIAFNTEDSLVQDDYYKKGLAINFHLDRIDQAKDLGLQIKIELNSKTNLLLLKLTSLNTQAEFDLPDNLILKLSHPTLKNKDKNLALAQLSGNDYITELKDLGSSYWHISIEDDKQTWLLKSRWLYPDSDSIEINANSI